MNPKRIDKLFLQFGAFYGQIWRSHLKDERFIQFMKQEWQVALQDIDDKTLELATNDCRLNRELPPTLPQFVEMCRDAIKRGRPFVKRLCLQEPRNPVIASEHLSKIKTILNIKP